MEPGGEVQTAQVRVSPAGLACRHVLVLRSGGQFGQTGLRADGAVLLVVVGVHQLGDPGRRHDHVVGDHPGLLGQLVQLHVLRVDDGLCAAHEQVQADGPSVQGEVDGVLLVVELDGSRVTVLRVLVGAGLRGGVLAHGLSFRFCELLQGHEDEHHAQVEC